MLSLFNITFANKTHQSTRSLQKDLHSPRTNLSKSFPMSILVRKILSYYHDQRAEFLWLRANLPGARNIYSAHSHKQWEINTMQTHDDHENTTCVCVCVAPLLFQWQFILIHLLPLDSISSKCPSRSTRVFLIL